MSKKAQRFDDGSDARRDFRARGRGVHSGRRKTQQLCAQVRRTIELTLVGDCEDEVLQNLQVEVVEPAPDDSRLRVVLSVHGADAERPRADVEQRLEHARGLIAREVTNAITRRKSPELVFELVRGSGTSS